MHRASVCDAVTRRFIGHNRERWTGWASRCSDAPVILTDLYTVAETNVARSYFLNVLARKCGARIESVQAYGGDRWLHEVYRSFNTAAHMNPVLTDEQRERKNHLTAAALGTVRTKQDLYDLTVRDVWIGVDVYETYLREYSRPTVDLDDELLRVAVDRAIGLLVFWEDMFAGRPVAAVVASHDCYIDGGVLAKVAWKHGVSVYSPNPIYMTCARQPYTCHAHFPRYRELFRALSRDEQQEGIALARRQLQRRFSGEVGVDMPYSTSSAFGASAAARVLRESDRLKVLICTHCFFDNPHAYGGMLFVDFFEWLRYLGGISERTDYDWYLKTHPDPLPGTFETLQQIISRFPRITILPPETSHHQLAAEGLQFALTAYGSVGHEYPALGVQVVNAGYSPRIAYDFNHHPKSVEEYEAILLNLDRLEKKVVSELDLAEFYFMHHHYQYDDDLVFGSYRQMREDLREQAPTSSAAYGYFLDQFTPSKHAAIIESMASFIDSGKSHYFSRGPV